MIILNSIIKILQIVFTNIDIHLIFSTLLISTSLSLSDSSANSSIDATFSSIFNNRFLVWAIGLLDLHLNFYECFYILFLPFLCWLSKSFKTTFIFMLNFIFLNANLWIIIFLLWDFIAIAFLYFFVFDLFLKSQHTFFLGWSHFHIFLY